MLCEISGQTSEQAGRWANRHVNRLVGRKVGRQADGPENSYYRGRLSTVDLPVLTSSDQLPLKLKTLFDFL